MVGHDAAIKKKKKRLTSWQRKSSKKKSGGGESTRCEREEERLNVACQKAKAASQKARERHRLHAAALPGDAELVAEYVAARHAVRSHKTAKETAKQS